MTQRGNAAYFPYEQGMTPIFQYSKKWF